MAAKVKKTSRSVTLYKFTKRYHIPDTLVCDLLVNLTFVRSCERNNFFFFPPRKLKHKHQKPAST